MLLRYFPFFLIFLCLQPAQAEWAPVTGKMLTRWGKELKPDAAWQEYPRPQLQRDSWVNLNGLWDYAIQAKEANLPENWDGKILVPFAPEAALSGVGRAVEPIHSLWYQRLLPIKPKQGSRTLLHFDAIDYEATVWVNGKEMGQHKGGNTRFSLDITDALQESDNKLLVRVYDANEGFQLQGKQSRKPHGIWAGSVSGIWQTVWLEQVAARSIQSLAFQCNGSSKTIKASALLAGTPIPNEKLRVSVSFGGVEIAQVEKSADPVLSVPEPKWWTPNTPYLYDVKVDLLGAHGQVIDSVKSYTAFRNVGKMRDAGGNLRLALNASPIFLLGTLDQGWWPDGLLTPPSNEAMASDLIYLKKAGFNMVRKHVKVEPDRYYWHCDRLGIAVWQDQVSCFFPFKGPSSEFSTPWIRLARDPKDAQWPEAPHQQWILEYKRMVDQLRGHPSILIWSTFNEAWGQHRSMEIGKMAEEYDPTRLLCHASGGNFWPVGDIVSAHNYPHPTFPFADSRFTDYVKVAGEMGGHPWAVEGHIEDPSKRTWGYGGPSNSLEDWCARYMLTMRQMEDLRSQGVSAGVYTQTADFWTEVNGLLTLDRIPKMDANVLRSSNSRLTNPLPFQDEPIQKSDSGNHKN